MATVDRQKLLVAAGDLASGDEPCTIIDCRFNLMQPEAGREAFLQSHIPGAVYAHLDEDLAAPVTPESGRHPLPSADGLTRTFKRLGVGNERPVVVYDDAGGAIAARAWWLLRWAGHANVRVLDGGYPAWLESKLPVESGEFSAEPGNFEVKPDDSRILSTSQLAEDLTGIDGYRLVDARDAARYRGEVEPIDAVAGHIPGSSNVPFSDCLDDDGSWRSGAALRQRLDHVLGDDPTGPWSVMCGSGVTACHLAISGLLAGYEEPRLYVGSWSEWIRDPTRPVGRGLP